MKDGFNFATVEIIVYSLLNGKRNRTAKFIAYRADFIFEVEDAFIHIDLKLFKTRNIGDYTGDIFVGNNQNSYVGKR